MLHGLLTTWFHWVENWGYWGVFLLMVMESSVLPVPSEIVIPPAAFWAAQGRMSFWGVVLVGTFGSYVGAILMYGASRLLGIPFARRYGKQFELAESWIRDFGAGGVFFARLLPVLRHLIGIPAGLGRMPFARYSLSTTFGAFLWCTVLAWFGQKVIGDSPELLQSPEQMIAVMKAKVIWIIGGVLVFAALYGVVIYSKRRKQRI